VDDWVRLLNHQGLPLVPFLWRDLRVYGRWRLASGGGFLFLVRRQDPLMDVLLVRAAAPGPLCVVVESGRGLLSLRWLSACARRVPFGRWGDREAEAVRDRALEACAHQLAEGGSAALIAGGESWQGERVRPLEDYAGRLLERCAALSLRPSVVPLHLAYSPPRLGARAATVVAGEPLPFAACRGSGGRERLFAALSPGNGSGVPPQDLEILAGLAGFAAEGNGGGGDRHPSLPPDFEARVRAARLARPLEVREILRASRAYGEALQGTGATDRQARRRRELSLLMRASARAGVILLGALPALYGALVNAPPLLLSALFVRSAPGPGTPSPAQSRLLASLLLFLPYYATAALLVEGGFSWRGMALLLSLPVTGAWAMVYGALARAFFRAAWRLRRAPLRGGVAADLGALRRELEEARRALADLYGDAEGDRPP
jgi:hypothetical protein